jgi:hypothetical protein
MTSCAPARSLIGVVVDQAEFASRSPSVASVWTAAAVNADWLLVPTISVAVVDGTAVSCRSPRR